MSIFLKIQIKFSKIKQKFKRALKNYKKRDRRKNLDSITQFFQKQQINQTHTKNQSIIQENSSETKDLHL